MAQRKFFRKTIYSCWLRKRLGYRMVNRAHSRPDSSTLIGDTRTRLLLPGKVTAAARHTDNYQKSRHAPG